jgi:hypothetical protein
METVSREARIDFGDTQHPVLPKRSFKLSIHLTGESSGALDTVRAEVVFSEQLYPHPSPPAFSHTPVEYQHHVGHYYHGTTLVNQLSFIEYIVGSWLTARTVPTYCISGSNFMAGQILKGEKLEEMMGALRDRGSEVMVICEGEGEPLL